MDVIFNLIDKRNNKGGESWIFKVLSTLTINKYWYQRLYGRPKTTKKVGMSLEWSYRKNSFFVRTPTFKKNFSYRVSVGDFVDTLVEHPICHFTSKGRVNFEWFSLRDNRYQDLSYKVFRGSTSWS